MKKISVILLIFCICSCIFFAGCGNRELPPASITRDDARTGGTLSFVYDSKQKTVYIGGEDEVIQYSQEDETSNLSAGNRVGLKVTAPDESLDLSNATLKMNGVNYSTGDFLEIVNGNKQRFFIIKPLFTKEVKKATFIITWEENSKEQEYKVIIKDGTKFMNKQNEIE